MLRTVTPEPDFLEFLDTFTEHTGPQALVGLGPSTGPCTPANSSSVSCGRQLPVSCSAQSRKHQLTLGLQSFLNPEDLNLVPMGPQDHAQQRRSSRGSLHTEQQCECIEGDLLGPLLDSPPAQMLRTRDDVANDPLESLLEVCYHSAQGQLGGLQGSSSTATPVPTRTPDVSSSNSQVEVRLHRPASFPLTY